MTRRTVDQRTEISEIIHPTEVEGVSIIPGGPIPPNPAELLGSPRMSNLLERIHQVADIVLVDSPPVLVVADASVLSAQSDAAIVIVDGFKTRASSLRATLGTLGNAKIDIAGVIINKLKRPRFGYGYSYPYYYDYYNYSYYRTPVSGETQVNGVGPIYRRPIDWVRAAASRLHPPWNRP